jgi:hypothetical protein
MIAADASMFRAASRCALPDLEGGYSATATKYSS